MEPKHDLSIFDNQSENHGDIALQQDDYNVSADSMAAPDCSQITQFEFGEQDITHAILAYAPTQSVMEEGPPDSSVSERSLGKRKASDMSTTSNVSSTTSPCRPNKLPRSYPAPEMDGFFGETEKKVIVENPFAPIKFSPSKMLQNWIDVRKVPYGVQYEIARYVSLGRVQFRDIRVDWLDELAELSNHEAVPALTKILTRSPDVDVEEDLNAVDEVDNNWRKAFEKEHSSPWIELDREEEALGINSCGGLGFNEKGEHLNWYGGQVLFHARLSDTVDKKSKDTNYKMTLEHAELGTSNMFARRFGSKHFFRLKLTKHVLHKNADDLVDYLRRPLLLCGSVFRAFWAKDTNVFYVKTNERIDGETVIEDAPPIPGVKSLLEFLEWHNPMEYNKDQTMAKYVSRFGLGLSNSIPGLRMESDDIHFIDDITSEKVSNMTDGAGKINRWSLNQIRHRLDWEDKPTAIQVRLYGTKGLLVDDGGHAGECPHVELTFSQQKIKYPKDSEIDPAHRIIDVLRSSHTKTPCRVFDLLDKGLKELVEPLLDWESPEAMRKLWANIRRLGGVMSARRGREQVGLARVKGYSEKDAEDQANDEEGLDATNPAEQRSSAWWGDQISGCPSSLEETIMYMIEYNFNPATNPLMRDKLDKFIRSRIKNYVKLYRIDVPMSASAFIVPDTAGILEPGEVFFKSCRRQFQTPEEVETDILIGDILITRNPCKLPTDIQKWKAVDKPGLYHLTDVIVCSTKGDRRTADLLSGGDYDGDKAIFIWQPELVAPFKNAPLRFADPPVDIKSYFNRENVEVSAFLEKIVNTSVQNKIRQVQHHLLGAVRNTSVVGRYSGFHEMVIYTLGYTHKETIRLGYMFCMTVDGTKTGMTVSKSVIAEDSKKFSKRPPLWKESDEEKARYEQTNEAHVKRPPSLGRFIMDELCKYAETKNEHWNVQLDTIFKKAHPPIKLDDELAAPWYDAVEMAKRWKISEKSDRMTFDLERIRKHVEAMYVEHRGQMASPRKQTRGSPRKDKLAFSSMPIEVRQDKIRQLSKKFAGSPSPDDVLMCKEDVARYRASYAYIYDWEQKQRNGYARFPWDMAMRELGTIKARATGSWKTVAGEFYDHFNLKHPKTHHT